MNTQSRIVLASFVLVIGGMIFAVGHRSGMAAKVYAAPPTGCTNQTIVGQFVVIEQGFVSASTTGPQGIANFAPAAGVGVLVTDGQGNSFGSDTISIGGEIITRTSTGTYSVNPDCTGTAHIQFNAGPAVDIAIATDRSGKEIHSLQINPQGSVFTSVSRK